MPAREVDPSLAKPLAAVLTKAVSPRPADRYVSAADFAEELRRWLRGDAVEAGRPSVVRKTGRWLRRHPIMATAAVCAVIIAVSLMMTFVSIQYLLTQPNQISYSADLSQAQLLSVGGAVLKQWGPASDPADRYITRVFKGAGPLAGRRFVAAGYSTKDRGPWQRYVCVFDIDRSLSEPVWSDCITDDDLPQSLLAADWRYRGEQFSAHEVKILDVLDDPDGAVEIIVVFAHGPRSPRVVRCYSIDGELLMQFWHDGTLATPQYLPSHNLLIFAGDNKAARWSDRGVELDDYPQAICLAIRPQRGSIGREFIDTSPPFDVASPVAWYKTLWPPQDNIQFEAMRAAVPDQESRRDDYILLDLRKRNTNDNDNVTLRYHVRYDGRLMTRTATPGEKYAVYQQRGEAPDPSTLSLEDLPPVEADAVPAVGRDE